MAESNSGLWQAVSLAAFVMVFVSFFFFRDYFVIFLLLFILLVVIAYFSQWQKFAEYVLAAGYAKTGGNTYKKSVDGIEIRLALKNISHRPNQTIYEFSTANKTNEKFEASSVSDFEVSSPSEYFLTKVGLIKSKPFPMKYAALSNSPELVFLSNSSKSGFLGNYWYVEVNRDRINFSISRNGWNPKEASQLITNGEVFFLKLVKALKGDNY